MSETTDTVSADAAAAKAAEDAKAAASRADQVRQAAIAAAQARADAVEAARPRWETVFRAGADVTERLVLAGGYLLRSAWQHVNLGQMAGGSSLTFVPGEAPPLVPFDANVLALTVADLKAGVDPVDATIDDVHPIRQLAGAAEVILWLSDGSVRVLKSRDAASVNTVRAAVAADGPRPV